MGSFSYTSRVTFIFIWEASLTHPVLVSFSFFFISCCLYFSAWSFSYTSRASIIFMKEFLLHIPCWLLFFLFFFFFSFFFVSFFFLFILGVSLTHTVLGSFFSFFLYISGVSLTHPMLDSFSSWEFPRTATQRLKKKKLCLQKVPFSRLLKSGALSIHHGFGVGKTERLYRM